MVHDIIGGRVFALKRKPIRIQSSRVTMNLSVMMNFHEVDVSFSDREVGNTSMLSNTSLAQRVPLAKASRVVVVGLSLQRTGRSARGTLKKCRRRSHFEPR